MALFTGRTPSAKFNKIGDSVEGSIVEVEKRQRYQFSRDGSGGPMFWHNRRPTENARYADDGSPNDPVLDLVLTLETGVADENGDTERRVFLKNKRMNTALEKAVLTAGAKREGLLIGGRLQVTFSAEETGDGPNPYKVYDFVYGRPEEGQGSVPDVKISAVTVEEKAGAGVEAAVAAHQGRAVSAGGSYETVPSGGVRQFGNAAVNTTTHQAMLRQGTDSAAAALGVKARQDVDPPF